MPSKPVCPNHKLHSHTQPSYCNRFRELYQVTTHLSHSCSQTQDFAFLVSPCYSTLPAQKQAKPWICLCYYFLLVAPPPAVLALILPLPASSSLMKLLNKKNLLPCKLPAPQAQPQHPIHPITHPSHCPSLPSPIPLLCLQPSRQSLLFMTVLTTQAAKTQPETNISGESAPKCIRKPGCCMVSSCCNSGLKGRAS